ncbi:MAG TPA: hypothetical protein VHL31_21000 [Geminicoccus sp.]|jgi:hypothetical protein|uniref:hypothetical protein n=1 Tax=Geminicoccus sp. TaxID=2024832 RepID=UPI002E2FDF21|nr:hypothetical protein [Geminicoccus sp.]HEX2528758.1 hypothetical protein [Geminicoccus sp.]
MPEPTAPPTRTTTALDLQLAGVYFPILVELAKDKRTISQGDLIERAKALHPQRKSVQKVIAVSLARRLEVVRSFCQERGLPDLSSLVASNAAGEDGATPSPDADPIELRRQVFSFDWSTVATDFADHVREGETSPTPKTKINEKQAIQIMWDHYKSNMTSIPKSVTASRTQIIADILAGSTVEDAFSKAILANPPVVTKKRSS